MTERKPLPSNSARDPLFDGLKRLFDDLAKEPVPQEFLDLLAKIDAKEAARKTKTPKGGRK